MLAAAAWTRALAAYLLIIVSESIAVAPTTMMMPAVIRISINVNARTWALRKTGGVRRCSCSSFMDRLKLSEAAYAPAPGLLRKPLGLLGRRAEQKAVG